MKYDFLNDFTFFSLYTLSCSTQCSLRCSYLPVYSSNNLCAPTSQHHVRDILWWDDDSCSQRHRCFLVFSPPILFTFFTGDLSSSHHHTQPVPHNAARYLCQSANVSRKRDDREARNHQHIIFDQIIFTGGEGEVKAISTEGKFIRNDEKAKSEEEREKLEKKIPPLEQQQRENREAIKNIKKIMNVEWERLLEGLARRRKRRKCLQ